MNKTDLLLQMMEQPKRYTAEEWQEILANDECRELYTLMSETQSAVDAARADEEVTDEMIDAEWQRLARPHLHFSISSYQFRKFAAMFIGVLMLSGIAYAAIHIVSHRVGGDWQSTTQERRIPSSRQSALSADTTMADTIPMKAKLYDNVPLGEIFEELSIYYHVEVIYQNEDAPRLRLFYRWKPEYTLEKVVEMMNNFDWIQIQLENDTLFIRTTAIPATDV